MQCDLCGKESMLFRVKIEGTILNVCKNCSQYGKAIAKVSPFKTHKVVTQRPHEKTERVVENFAALIRNKRESIGLKQKDFAKQINEKESIIHKLETSHFEPSIKLARKIERFLSIILVEEAIQGDFKFRQQKSKPAGFTLGDAIKIRKK